MNPINKMFIPYIGWYYILNETRTKEKVMYESAAITFQFAIISITLLFIIIQNSI